MTPQEFMKVAVLHPQSAKRVMAARHHLCQELLSALTTGAARVDIRKSITTFGQTLMGSTYGVMFVKNSSGGRWEITKPQPLISDYWKEVVEVVLDDAKTILNVTPRCQVLFREEERIEIPKVDPDEIEPSLVPAYEVLLEIFF